MTLSKQISSFVEQMPEKSQEILLELVKTMVSTDDFLTDEDLMDIENARNEYANGETVQYSAVNWN